MEQSLPSPTLVEGVLYEQHSSGIFYRTTYVRRAYRVELLHQPETALRLRLAKRAAAPAPAAQSAVADDAKGDAGERTAAEIAAEVDAEAMDEQCEDVEGAGGRGDDLIINAVVHTQPEPSVQLPALSASNDQGLTGNSGRDGIGGNAGGGGINAALLGWFGGNASCGEEAADPDAAPLLAVPEDTIDVDASQATAAPRAIAAQAAGEDARRSATSVVVECTSVEEWRRALRYGGTPARGG